MNRTIWIATLAAIVAGSVIWTSAPASAGTCFMSGGAATMVTEDLAKFMANAAMNNSRKAKNAKAVGPVTMKCKSDTLTTTCTARQKAC